jgi:aryl-alcohol dehydrogenase-like predicted oxidoreductase
MRMKRRDFVLRTAAAASLLAVSPFEALVAADTKRKYANDIVTLGKSGIKVSRLAMGTGTLGFNHHSSQTERLGIRGVADLLKAAHDQGITFWDSADAYGTHPHLREALKSVPRDKVVILTKSHATTAEEMRADLERFRKEIGTDYLDIVLLHLMTDPDWPTQKAGAMEELSRAREKGIVRAHGVSCHTLGALKTAAATPWVEIDLARINPAGAVMDADPPTVVSVLRRMHEEGKGVVGMKIFGSGQLRNRIDECLRYVLGLDCVDAFTIGQQSQTELRDLLKRIPDAGISG